jgi:hypothetical protein
MVNSVTRSYEYSALCDVCKFKFKASQLRLRWDGLQVCKWDWEQRHPADFYRGRNDAHKLPWTRSDDGPDPGGLWANPQGAITAVTVVNDGVETTGVLQIGNYQVNPLTLKTTGNAMLVFFLTPINGVGTAGTQIALNPQSTTSSVGSTLTLPTVPGVSAGGGNIVLRTSEGKILSTAAVTAGSASVAGLSWTRARGHLLVSFTYGT